MEATMELSNENIIHIKMHNTWEEIEEECKNCEKCKLYTSRTRVVFRNRQSKS